MVSILILTQSVQGLFKYIPEVLKAVSAQSAERLYIHLDNSAVNRTPSNYMTLAHKSHLISKIYSLSPALCPGVDIRVLLCGFKNYPFSFNSKRIKNVFIDKKLPALESKALETKYTRWFSSNSFISLISMENEDTGRDGDFKNCDTIDDNIYEEVVVGGTFDRIHPGHKILLSEAALRCSRKFTIGVANGPLLERKILKELILPCSQRIECVREFISDIDPTLQLSLVEIIEPMGPTGYDPNLELLVVSEETKKGIKMINDHRKKIGIGELKGYIINIFVDCQKQNLNEEDKFSSSSQRMRLLGSRIKTVAENLDVMPNPYVIGLTGGIASGKTTIARKLKELGAAIIDCDKLGHKSYEHGSSSYYKLIEIFGEEILSDSREIERKLLGPIVFNNGDKMKLLTDVVWPHIAVFAHNEIEAYKEQGKKIVVLDAAVLLEAKWNEFCNEVWVATIDREEAIKRIVERNQLSEADAALRIGKQMTNEERCAHANVVFCSLWSYSYTFSQIQKTWDILRNEGRV